MKNNSTSKLAVIAVVPVLALMIALIGGAFTQRASAQTPNSSRPFAVGGFTTLTEHVAFAAQTNPKTGAPMGHVVQELSIGTNSGKVKCFQPSGNMATISFLVDTGPDVGQYVTFMVADNGEPSAVNTSMDMYSDCGPQNTNCGTDMCGGFQAVIRGNIVVSQ